MPPLTLARHAMATRFELVLHGENPVALRAAGEEALDEIERLESQLSLFRPSSEVAHLNARAAWGPVRVTPGLFALLQHAKELHAETQGAFDITVAPLVRCWGFMGGTGSVPKPEELESARAKVGMHLVELNRADFTVRFAREGVMLDLGAIGKGYAVERATELLREAGVTSALLHGGTSTVYAVGSQPDGESWRVAVENPRTAISSRAAPAEPQPASPGPLTTVPLKDEAMSVSGVWGKSFEAEGQVFGHVLDPRSGRPVSGAVLAAVVLPSATETDALSTALLTLGLEGHDHIAGLRPGMRTLVVADNAGGFEMRSHGITPSE
ncbi:MAG TPA: FAD:protein FMN transferase [Candidatus Acidoferrum sp.]|jgi:thiamine biosynthesis lipoprotein|nr:FAD:protein FMN transferase [Candidatus Acidoferrum sp.]